MICGVSALKTVFSMENTSAIKNKCAFPRRKWRISPVRLRLTARFSFFKSFSSSLSWNPLFIGFPFSFSKEKSIPEAIRDALKPRFLWDFREEDSLRGNFPNWNLIQKKGGQNNRWLCKNLRITPIRVGKCMIPHIRYQQHVTLHTLRHFEPASFHKVSLEKVVCLVYLPLP